MSKSVRNRCEVADSGINNTSGCIGLESVERILERTDLNIIQVGAFTVLHICSEPSPVRRSQEIIAE